jgi:hypothetical protein
MYTCDGSEGSIIVPELCCRTSAWVWWALEKPLSDPFLSLGF